jgi:hypothetical protein
MTDSDGPASIRSSSSTDGTAESASGTATVTTPIRRRDGAVARNPTLRSAPAPPCEESEKDAG